MKLNRWMTPRALATLIRSHRPHGANACTYKTMWEGIPSPAGGRLTRSCHRSVLRGAIASLSCQATRTTSHCRHRCQGTAHPVIQVPEMSDTALVRSKERAVVAKEDPLLNHPDSIKIALTPS